MNVKRFEIEPIHKIGDLDPWEYGAKASQLRSLANLGLPVPEGFFLSTEVVNEASRNPTFKISNKFICNRFIQFIINIFNYMFLNVTNYS